jgi:hypothetical protein
MIETLIFIAGAVVGSLIFSLMCAAKRGDEQASQLALTVAVMSCVEVTPSMAAMLGALANDEPPDQYRDTPEWKNARAWGWVMESGELTGIGSRHIPGERPRGILPTGL